MHPHIRVAAGSPLFQRDPAVIRERHPVLQQSHIISLTIHSVQSIIKLSFRSHSPSYKNIWAPTVNGCILRFQRSADLPHLKDVAHLYANLGKFSLLMQSKYQLISDKTNCTPVQEVCNFN